MTERSNTIKPFHAPGSQEKLKKRPWGEKELFEALNKLTTTDEGSLIQDKNEIKQILDVGFGATARSSLALAKFFPEAFITAIDNNAEALEAIHKLTKDSQPPSNLKFYFGDPEFALPKLPNNKKFDLIVLCMVCHCFDYPYRAIANLIENSLEKNGYILFVHRTDPFMKAICYEQDERIKNNDAANAIWEAWEKLQEHPDPCCRLICEHTEFLKHFMREVDFTCITMVYDINLEKEEEEEVENALKTDKYSPIEGKGNYLFNYLKKYSEKYTNKEIQLSLYLYQATDFCKPIPDIGRYTHPVFIHSGTLRIEDIQEMESYLSRNNIQQDMFTKPLIYREKIRSWFIEEGPFNSDDLKYGFYVDLRFVSPDSEKTFNRFRNQIWPENQLKHEPPKGSISLIYALNKFVSPDENEKLLQVIVWTYIPNMSYWYYNDYVYMSGVLDFDDHKPCWILLPYIKEEETGNKDFLDVIYKAFGQQNKKESWEPLVPYLTSLVDVLRKENISNTYYFTYRDAYSDNREPVAFSFQCTRWLNANEVMQLSTISQSALATINEGMSALYRLDKNKYDQINKDLINLSSGLKPLRELTANVERIQEIMNPDIVFPGTDALREFGHSLNTIFSNDGDHRPCDHIDNKILLDTVNTNNEKYSHVKEGLFNLLKDTLNDVSATNLLVNKFLEPMNRNENLDNNIFINPLPSLCLAKSISRNFIPAAWVIFAINEKFQIDDDKLWKNYIEMEDMGSCLRVIKALRRMRNQLKLEFVGMHKSDTGEGNIYTIITKPKYIFYQQLQETTAPIVFGWHGNMPVGLLRKALFWLREDFKVYLSKLPEKNKIPENRKGDIGIGDTNVTFRFKAVEYEAT